MAALQLPALPQLELSLADLKSSYRGPTKRSNWVVPGLLMAGDRSSVDSEQGLRAILSSGITTFICLQTRQETKIAVDYSKRAKALSNQVQFYEQPIPDQDVIDDALVGTLICQLVHRLEQGEVLYVHCRGGHGRTGTVCALLLARLYSLSAIEAMQRVQLYHDTRMQPVFCAEGYEALAEDGEGCVVLFPVQRQQVLRLVQTTATAMAPEASDLVRASSSKYGPGASNYDESTMKRWFELGQAANAALRSAKEKDKDKETYHEELRRAVEAYREALELRPDFVRGHVGLARALRLLGENAEALETLHGAHARWPEDALVLEEMKRIPQQYEADTKEAAKEALKEAAKLPDPPPLAQAPPTWSIRIKDPRFVMLVGLPGAGKSTFSQQLVKSCKGWERICQDEAGGRAAVDSSIGALCKDPSTKVILDRCNELKADRKYFLELAFNPTPAVCVYFDMNAAACEARVASRTDHPTIPYGRGRGAVRSKTANFQVPTDDEGFQEIITLQDFSDANHLLSLWGAEVPDVSPPGFFKFPKTPHVIDLGGNSHVPQADAARFLDGRTVVVVEEKIDGINCGISLTLDYELKFQNQDKYVTSASASHWQGLEDWQAEYAGAICMLLEPEVEVLFGEWCAVPQSIGYTDLPAYFLAFDIYNKREGRFCSTRERNRRLSEVGIPAVPFLAEQTFACQDDLLRLLEQPSTYYHGPMEGLYLRIDEPVERGGGLWLERRGKIVQLGDCHKTLQ
eukprot:gnl/MRDRNA2_/MRDRNA2_43740_c0_seq1.p1 gnl/MRDRNA2_/MRDRNA2_43740_c0~~gnl/MRDRNA2_/MRDRNA2_43740_c0_seq1.p1  ORF type:complete len:743 (+),score=141.05 gnl/MRDRNA2_/MRDRNA2_43740_c0_seq1:95-2323(+)